MSPRPLSAVYTQRLRRAFRGQNHSSAISSNWLVKLRGNRYGLYSQTGFDHHFGHPTEKCYAKNKVPPFFNFTFFRPDCDRNLAVLCAHDQERAKAESRSEAVYSRRGGARLGGYASA